MLNVRSGAGVTVYDKKIIAVGGHKGAEIHRSAEVGMGKIIFYSKKVDNLDINRRGMD